MINKAIEVPESTERIDVQFYTSVDDKGPDYPNGDASFMVDDLPDVPDKRVIELPANVVSLLNEHKAKHPDYLISFLKDLDYSLELSVREEIGESFYNDIASWYLGHVEFVEKKEPKFYVRVDVDGEKQSVARWQNSDGESGIVFDVFMRNEPTYTEVEADKLVAGLTALNARKVKVED